MYFTFKWGGKETGREGTEMERLEEKSIRGIERANGRGKERKVRDRVGCKRNTGSNSNFFFQQCKNGVCVM